MEGSSSLNHAGLSVSGIVDVTISRRPRQDGSVGERDLLDRLGTLINESYIAVGRAELFWPGSSRPKIHSLTDQPVVDRRPSRNCGER
jgi:hypothetical protein